ncbi:MAG: biotin--[acetyl-CoA-carboxylase] ligase [Candidatus Omnitrophota bacterium]
MTSPDVIHLPGSPLKVIRLEECDSTNNYLKSHLEELKSNFPVLITSVRQTCGRGRETRIWISPKGKGLYASFGLRLQTNQHVHLLSLIAGISVIETLKLISGKAFTLKWPNDVLFERKKIAGILIENVISGDTVYCIVGIGINLNHRAEDFPSELVDKAISLKMVSGISHDYAVEDVSPMVSAALFNWLEKMKQGFQDEIIQTANALSASLINGHISFHQSPDRIIQGIYQGIDHDGGVRIEMESGRIAVYYSGEIV